MLGRIMKIFISSILQRRPRIFKESFLLGRIIKPFFQFCKKDTVYLRSFFAWQKNKDFFSSNLPSFMGHFLQFIIVSKINQGSCLGCLGGDDAPVRIGILQESVFSERNSNGSGIFANFLQNLCSIFSKEDVYERKLA